MLWLVIVADFCLSLWFRLRCGLVVVLLVAFLGRLFGLLVDVIPDDWFRF